uniref:Uncharacterized protein n=1 Tax=Stomoxys calcitrans TaxID=35570 RepID=A0A1I8QDH9_STOCA
MSNSDSASLLSPPFHRRAVATGSVAPVHTTVTLTGTQSSMYKGMPQTQISLPAPTTHASASSAAVPLNKSSSCPDSPIRRVSSSLRNSAVGLATRFFNKCRAATFTVDGATYTIVASTPENLPKREDSSSCSTVGGGAGNSNSSGNLGCSSQIGFAASTPLDCSSSTQATSGGGPGSGGGGGISNSNTHDFTKITSPPGVDGTSESVNFSITNNSVVSSLNGQVARHGALTIVRRSNSRKSFAQLESQHLHQQASTPTPSSNRGSFLADDTLGKAPANNNTPQQHDNLFNESLGNIGPQTYSLAQTPTTTHSAQQLQTHQHTPPLLKMLPTSPNSSNTAPLVPTATDTQDENASESILSMDESASAVASAKASVDLATENLPAVDTPDACDKAALRLRYLLRMLSAGEISADVLQKNLHYAARVLEAVFIDESKDEAKNDRCNGDCKNIECQHHHHNNKLQGSSSDNNNTDQSLCSLRTTNEESGGKMSATSEEDSQHQMSIDSRTKGVCSAPQTHSGPTGPPVVEGHVKDSEASTTAAKDEGENKEAANTTTTSSTTHTCSTTSSTSTTQNNSTVSSSSSSNKDKATIQRQKRLRTPVWARSMSTNKTYIILKVFL